MKLGEKRPDREDVDFVEPLDVERVFEERSELAKVGTIALDGVCGQPSSMS